MNIPTAICCVCRVAMRCQKNSVLVEMMTKDGHGESMSLYKIDSDRWQCPKCGIQILTGFADEPFAEHWQEKYAERSCDVQARFE